MIVFLYDPNTFDYIAPPYTVPKGPFDDDLIPTYCAMVEPPAFNPATQTCKWNGDAWVVADIPVEQDPDPEPQPEPTDEEKWQLYKSGARANYNTAQVVAIECFKNDIAYPAEWLAYSNALADILLAQSGDPTVPLPIPPAVPVAIKLV